MTIEFNQPTDPKKPPEKPLVVPTVPKPEVEKKHIKRDGKK